MESGVKVVLNTCVSEITSTTVLLSHSTTTARDPSLATNKEEEVVPADLVICTTGMQPNRLTQDRDDLQVDDFGRVIVTETLQTPHHPNVFALGDCASVQNQSLSCTAQVAIQQSTVVANNISAVLSLAPLPSSSSSPNVTKLFSQFLSHQDHSNKDKQAHTMHKFKYFPLGEMVALGREDATLAGHGPTSWIHLKGPLAAVTRRLVYAGRMPTNAQRISSIAGLAFQTFGKFIKKV